MKKRGVKITGIGPITPAGCGREAFWRGILEPLSRVTSVRLAGHSTNVVAAGQVHDFRVGAFALDAVHLASPRHVQFALAAAVLALRDAGLSVTEARKHRPLVMVAPSVMEAGGSNDGSLSARKALQAFLHADDGVTIPSLPPMSLAAIGFAADKVASGEVDLAICGASESALVEATITKMQAEALAATHAREPGRQCRPFDLWRTTGVPGEGACMLVLESEGSPRRAQARVAGWAASPDQAERPWSGFDEAFRLCLGNSGVRPGMIDCIHTYGTGSKRGDAFEAAALVRAFGSRLGGLPAVALKGTLGNALGAAGAIEVGCAAPSMRHSLLPPSPNWQTPDPACPLCLSPSARTIVVDTSLIIERDMQGDSCCLILRR